MFPSIGNFEYSLDDVTIQKQDIVELLMMRKYSQLTFTLKTNEENLGNFEGTLSINSVSLKNYASKIPKYKDYLSDAIDHSVRSNRTKVVEMACDFLRSKKGNKPDKYGKNALVNAIYNLFPKLKKYQHETVLRWISQKFDNNRRILKQVGLARVESQTDQPADQQHVNIADKISFLKAAHVIIDEQMIIKYLKDTVLYRVNEIKENNNLNIKETYNFFITRPLYVSICCQ